MVSEASLRLKGSKNMCLHLCVMAKIDVRIIITSSVASEHRHK